MKILFMRHGESKTQAKQIESNSSDSINGLTNTGVIQVKKAALEFQDHIDIVFSSPYNRAQQTASLFLNNLNIQIPILIDNRLKEIDYGVFNIEDKNNPEMISVATKQIAGDYEVRFGNTGENKREIITRFFSFLIEIFNKYSDQDSVLVVSHGRAISIVCGEIYTINNQLNDYKGVKNAQIRKIELSKQTIEKMVQHIKKINQK